MDYGRIIKQLRKANNVKQSILASKLNISESNLSMCENGTRKLSKQDFIRALKYLGYFSETEKEDIKLIYLKELENKGWKISQGGLSKDFLSLNNNYISVELNEYGDCCYIIEDVESKGNYLTWDKFYKKNYDDIYYNEYHGGDDYYINIIGYNSDSERVEINKTNIFSKEIENIIVEDFNLYLKSRGFSI